MYLVKTHTSPCHLRDNQKKNQIVISIFKKVKSRLKSTYVIVEFQLLMLLLHREQTFWQCNLARQLWCHAQEDLGKRVVERIQQCSKNGSIRNEVVLGQGGWKNEFNITIINISCSCSSK